MISNKSFYGIRALVYLAINARGGHVGVKDIATSQDIPLRFLELIFSRLKASEIVTSVRGAGGGYYLARSPSQITLADVIFACEGASEFAVPAALSERMNNGDPVGQTMIKVIDRQLELLQSNLRSITLADIIQSAGLSSEMYFI
jgi:Rrf2 family transcriptional regulator, cysteine metabolism repressor